MFPNDLPRRYIAMFWLFVSLGLSMFSWAAIGIPRTPLGLTLVLAWGLSVFILAVAMLSYTPPALHEGELNEPGA